MRVLIASHSIRVAPHRQVHGAFGLLGRDSRPGRKEIDPSE